MFPPMELDGGTEYYLKPMNCPMHILIYRSRTRSYRELPLRLFEFGTVYRYEKSGVIHGLTRVRGLTMDDAHIFTTKEQMGEELRSLLVFVLDLLRDYGLDDFYLELSTRPEDKAVGSDEEWAEATEALRLAAESMDLRARDGRGRRARSTARRSACRRVMRSAARGRCPRSRWTSSSRSGSTCTTPGDDNERHRPIMIHRALFGSVERFFGVLTEHYAGAFPLWLAPEQVRFVAGRRPSRRALRGARRQGQGRRAAGRSSTIRRRSVGKKIRAAQLMKAPYTLVIGDQELESGAVHRSRSRGHRAPGRGVRPISSTALLAEADSRALEQTDFGGRPERGSPLESVADGVHRVRVPRNVASTDGACVFCVIPDREPERVLATRRARPTSC